MECSVLIKEEAPIVVDAILPVIVGSYIPVLKKVCGQFV